MENPTIVFPASRRVELQDRPVPEPGPGQALIRTRCTLISTGTELSRLDGDRPRGKVWSTYGAYPSVPGYCNIGTVVGVGEGVEKDWIGKRVATHNPHVAYATAPVNACALVPDEVSDEEASFFTLAVISLNGLRRSRLVFGESAVIYGLGIIGQLTTQFCQFAGARPVIGVDLSQWRIDHLPDRPGIIGVNAGSADVKEAVAGATKNRMADVVFELTGNPDVIPQEIGVLRRQGRIVILSSPISATRSFDFHDLCNSPSITIIGAHNGSHPEYPTGDNPWTKKRHTELFFDLLRAGEIEVANLVSHRVPPEQAPQTYRMLLEDRSRALGIVFVWPQD